LQCKNSNLNATHKHFTNLRLSSANGARDASRDNLAIRDARANDNQAANAGGPTSLNGHKGQSDDSSRVTSNHS
jgi:hypothetical protein